MARSEGELSFVFREVMDETLLACIDHLEWARHSDQRGRLKLHLCLSAKALKHALQLYLEEFGLQPEVQKEKV